MNVISWLIYPAFVVLGTFGAHVAVARGLPALAVLGALQVVMMIVVAGLERVMPEHVSWNEPKNDTTTDAIFLIVSGLGVSSIVRAIVFAGIPAIPNAPAITIWPARWPLALQLVLALVVFDLGSYFTHVVEHKIRWIWPIHAPHHSARRLYFLNATRMHPIDQAVTVLFGLAPLAVLGASVEVLVLFDAFVLTHLMIQHSNIRLRHGLLNHVIATAEFHRWHHSRKRVESECNYASVISLWDHVFRTFRMPKGQHPPRDVGLYDDATLPDDFAGQLAAPFRMWSRRDTPN